MRRRRNDFGIEIYTFELNVDTDPRFSPFSGAEVLLAEDDDDYGDGWAKQMPGEVVFAAVGCYVQYAHPWVLEATGTKNTDELEGAFKDVLEAVLTSFHVPPQQKANAFVRHLVAISTVGDCERPTIVYAPDLVEHEV